MSTLDPTAISDPDDYTPANFRDKCLVIRQFKRDIRDQVSADFQKLLLWQLVTVFRELLSQFRELRIRVAFLGNLGVAVQAFLARLLSVLRRSRGWVD